jgi:hypothetical protein
VPVRIPILHAPITSPHFSFRSSLSLNPARHRKAPDVPKDLPPQIETLQPGVKLTLLAEHPDLVTPTGIDVDEKGNIWLASCHTHFRPRATMGPSTMRSWSSMPTAKTAASFTTRPMPRCMSNVGPDGWIYLAERDRILRVKDTNGDGVGDLEENLATMNTLADYPHNGLSGMAWHPDGGLVFSLGENFGKDWTITATDGTKVSGRGEGGVFRCTADGKQPAPHRTGLLESLWTARAQRWRNLRR